MSFSWFALGFLKVNLSPEMLEIFPILKRADQGMSSYLNVKKTIL